jgi:hypothetical protein
MIAGRRVYECRSLHLPIESAHSLLAAEHRRQLLDRIWQYTALSHAQFAQLYLNPIHRYAEQGCHGRNDIPADLYAVCA